MLLDIETSDFIFGAKYLEGLGKFEIVMFHCETLEIVGRVINDATSDFKVGVGVLIFNVGCCAVLCCIWLYFGVRFARCVFDL